MPGPAVELLHVRKTYREGDSERAVLSDVSVAIEPGEIRRPRRAERVASLQITPQQALRGRRGDPTDAALSRRAMPPDDEVLQFIGDAALVVFPARAETGGRRGACQAALGAALAALDAAATVNRARADAGRPTFRFGIGLHVGAVSWFGGVDRLGLNVIGPAVNRTARIETLTKEVGVPLLLSQDFADALGLACRPVGTFELKGVPEPQAVYALGDQAGEE